MYMSVTVVLGLLHFVFHALLFFQNNNLESAVEWIVTHLDDSNQPESATMGMQPVGSAHQETSPTFRDGSERKQ